jgi:hypothetical protein
MRITNGEFGQLASGVNFVADEIESVVCVAVIAPVSSVFAPDPTRQKYELLGVRSTGVETLLSRLG